MNVTASKGDLLVETDNTISVSLSNDGKATSGTLNVIVDDESRSIPLEDFTGETTIDVTYNPSTTGAKDVKVEFVSDDATQTLYEGTLNAYYNGYRGKSFTGEENFTTKREYTGRNTLILEQYDYYNWNTTSTATYDASDLEADKIVDALYYQGYNWDKNLNFKLTVNGEDAPIIANYSDTKGFGTYNYPSGLVVFNITGLFQAGQTNTITPVQLENNSNILYGGVLVIIYANNTNNTTILINEETDLLNPESSGLTTNDYTKAYSLYENVDTTAVTTTLYTITAAADKADGSKIIFNDVEYGCMADNYNNVSKLSVVRSDISNSQEGTNTVTLQSLNDNLVVFGTILVTTNERLPEETTVVLDPISIKKGESVNISANITAEDIVDGGKVYFKINGKIMRDDEGKIIYAEVTDGRAVIENYNNTGVWNDKTTIQALYNGNQYFLSSNSEKITPSITQEESGSSGGSTPESPSISVDSVTASAGETISITVRLNNIDDGKVVLKVAGKTVKTADGKLYAKVDGNEITFTYTLPKTIKAGEHEIKAVYSGSSKLEATSILTVE